MATRSRATDLLRGVTAPDTFGHILKANPDRLGVQANSIFSPLEMLKRMAKIRRRIRKELKALGDSLSREERRALANGAKLKQTADELREQRNRTCRRADARDAGLILADCCLCRRPLVGVSSPRGIDPGTRIQRAAVRDPRTGLSYCKGCAAEPVRVRLEG